MKLNRLPTLLAASLVLATSLVAQAPAPPCPAEGGACPATECTPATKAVTATKIAPVELKVVKVQDEGKAAPRITAPLKLKVASLESTGNAVIVTSPSTSTTASCYQDEKAAAKPEACCQDEKPATKAEACCTVEVVAPAAGACCQDEGKAAKVTVLGGGDAPPADAKPAARTFTVTSEGGDSFIVVTQDEKGTAKSVKVDAKSKTGAECEACCETQKEACAEACEKECEEACEEACEEICEAICEGEGTLEIEDLDIAVEGIELDLAQFLPQVIELPVVGEGGESGLVLSLDDVTSTGEQDEKAKDRCCERCGQCCTPNGPRHPMVFRMGRGPGRGMGMGPGAAPMGRHLRLRGLPGMPGLRWHAMAGDKNVEILVDGKKVWSSKDGRKDGQRRVLIERRREAGKKDDDAKKDDDKKPARPERDRIRMRLHQDDVAPRMALPVPATPRAQRAPEAPKPPKAPAPPKAPKPPVPPKDGAMLKVVPGMPATPFVLKMDKDAAPSKPGIEAKKAPKPPNDDLKALREELQRLRKDLDRLQNDLRRVRGDLGPGMSKLR